VHDARRAVVAEIRKLQAADRQRRDARPELMLPGALLDLITSCGLQYYADHAVTDDMQLLDQAVQLLERAQQPSTDTVACVHRLERETRPWRAELGDLDADDALRRIVVEVPPEVLLGRRDEEASPDLVCWNEAIGLLDEVSTTYRCASRISALAYFNAPDRYGVIDEMVALRQRYETVKSERDELDVVIRERIRRYLAWSQAGT
jgi:hypothetical protein